jgi:hypothetical protein
MFLNFLLKHKKPIAGPPKPSPSNLIPQVSSNQWQNRSFLANHQKRIFDQILFQGLARIQPEISSVMYHSNQERRQGGIGYLTPTQKLLNPTPKFAEFLVWG